MLCVFHCRPERTGIVLAAIVLCVTGCGKSTFENRENIRIVGGEPSSLGDWPWQVSLHLKNPLTGKALNQHCGGVLIHPEWVATAAHCVHDPLFNFPILAPFWIVRLGEVDLSLDETTEQQVTVKHIYRHEYFRLRHFINDIALFHLSQPVRVNDNSSAPICLPPRNETFQGRECFISGYGRLKLNSPKSRLLQSAKLPVFPQKNCTDVYRGVSYITTRNICAGFSEGGFGACVGDSGGPLQCKLDNDRWYLAGITSWGIGCGEPNRPQVFVRISAFLNWIHRKMGKLSQN